MEARDHRVEPRLGRREFLGGALALLAGPRLLRAHEAGLAPELVRALEKSGFVYISPIRSDGRESRCHGEVWYGWLDGAVVIATRVRTWKARALARGLDRARIWVGDHGRVRGESGPDAPFRKAPSFEARGEVSRDPALLDRLLAVYETKYPDEIGRWRDRMRREFEAGERVLILYRPRTPGSAGAGPPGRHRASAAVDGAPA